MITCNLTKLESALEQTRKAYPKLRPTDAALVASALSMMGRHAIALYDGQQYHWPEDYEALTAAMSKEVENINETVEAPKKSAKNAEEPEPVTLSVGLMPNLSAGERQLEGHDKLKALLSEAMTEGLEFNYQALDIGWQWALDRANWGTITGQDLARKIKVKATFTEGAVGIEAGTGTTKKRASRAKAPKEVAEPEE
ncbi:MAG TPA: hypothetical protein PKA27_05975 [Fimbriimonadaceae bacterium]|nr:hypothetical protein [Fimbriimonadaceae bacterium]